MSIFTHSASKVPATSLLVSIISIAFCIAFVFSLQTVSAIDNSLVQPTNETTNEPKNTEKSSLSTSQVESIINLLYSFNVDQPTITNVEQILRGTSDGNGSTNETPQFTRTLSVGIQHSDVSRLQELLAQDNALYPEGLVTGYYGTLTKQAVQRFQCRENIVCSGTPQTTGYGQFGPQTRAKLNGMHGNITTAPNEAQEDNNNQDSPGVCAQEAKICPDGSAVERTGPNCTFAACPSQADDNSTDGGGFGGGSNGGGGNGGSGNSGLVVIKYQNAPTTAPGKIGQGLSFDGVDDYIDVGNAGSGVQTVSFWMRAATTTTSIPLIDIDGTDKIETNSSNEIVATSFPSATVYVDSSTASASVSPTEWHHVVITDTTGVNASAMDIGRIGSSYFGGTIDDVRIYDRALPASEVKRLYQLGR